MQFVKIYAGLGNQMFQYCYGKYLELHYNKVRFISKKTQNHLTDIFNIDLNNFILSQSKISSLKVFCIKFFAKYITKSYSTDFYQNAIFPNSIHCKEIFTFRNEMEYKKSDIYHKIVTTNSVSLHIRGGDYLTSEYYNICTPEYFLNAINLINKSVKNPHFFIFTNDIEYANTIVQKINEHIPKNYTIANNASFAEDVGSDMFLMSQCKHNIISNSTYSWWGAYLNQNQNKTTIAPENWVNPKMKNQAEMDTINKILPDNWIKF